MSSKVSCLCNMRALAVAFGNFSISGMVIPLMLSGTLEFLGETKLDGLKRSALLLSKDSLDTPELFLLAPNCAKDTPVISIGIQPTPKGLVVYLS
jgi:hypothetical protein